MNLGLMQPYFLPYLGYFDLIRQTDFWIVLDNVQYIRRGWINRNRVLKRGGGWSYLNVPVRHASIQTPIVSIQIDETQPWRKRLHGQLHELSAHAPHYKAMRALIDPVLEDPTAAASLCSLNVRLLETICRYLGIDFKFQLLSAIAPVWNMTEPPQTNLLQVCRHLGASGYLNPAGGRKLYDPAAFTREGVNLEFQQFAPLDYPTPGFAFVENLSMVDVLAWNPAETIVRHLESQPHYFHRPEPGS